MQRYLHLNAKKFSAMLFSKTFFMKVDFADAYPQIKNDQ